MADDEDSQATAAPLNVMVRGEDVIVFLPGGLTVRLTPQDAEVSAQRLRDAADVARLQPPKPE